MKLTKFEELHAEILKASGITAWQIIDDLGCKIFIGWKGAGEIIRVSL